ncbi:hypothetical protein BS78_06G024100 [Paspalum vaginatum]|nr:hypothetical protein BS78_06G024100 [Paspalum vaginatum]
MEEHGGHPLLHGGHQQLQHGGAAATLAYASWDYTPGGAQFEDENAGDEQLADSCAFATAAELRRALVRALDELHASRAAHQAELRRVESEAARLAALVSSAAAERDELRRHCHSLLLLLHHQAQAQAAAVAPAPAPSPTSLLHGGGTLLHAGGGGATAVTNENTAPASGADDTAELEMALARRLPEKGRLVEAVVSAGPLLQTLLLAGPLPRWRHPPPPAPADIIPPFNPGLQQKADAASNSFSSASASAGSSSPESNCSGGPPPPTVAHAPPSFHMSMSPTSFCM